MTDKIALITGCAGLVGSDVCTHLDTHGYTIHGIDNNQRRSLFGVDGDTDWRLKELMSSLRASKYYNMDIRDKRAIENVIKQIQPDIIVHAAGQPSHDLATKIPYTDYEINVTGTVNILESVRQLAPECSFIYMSTNKVYGDHPNKIDIVEDASRFSIVEKKYLNGIDENMSVDQCVHSIFGASKTAADILVQEYGRCYNIQTCCLRAGCLTGG